MPIEPLQPLIIPYDDFQMGELIDPEQFDLNNEYIKNSVNNTISVVNTLTGLDGAKEIQVAPPVPFTSVTLQALIDELIARLTSAVEQSGASLIGTTPSANFSGETVEAQLKSINNLLNTMFVTTARISDLAVTTAKLAELSVITSKIADGAVTTPKVAQGAVTTDKLADVSVTNAKVADNAVTTAKIVDANVTTAKIRDDSVTTPKIVTSAVVNAKIADGAVTTPKIANANVTTEKITDLAVTSQKLAWTSVGTEHIKGSAVTQDKIANRAVTGVKIGLQTIKSENLDPILLDSLPNTLLTAKVLTLENEMDVAQFQIVNQGNAIDVVELDLMAHENARLPHIVTDEVTGIKYRTGWVVEEGELYFEYEEVE